MGRRGKRRTEFPYYKVHVYDQLDLVWRDARKIGFDSLEEAKEWIRFQDSGVQYRIMVVGREKRWLLDDESATP